MCRVPIDTTFHGGSNDTNRPCPTSAAEDITDLSRCAERTGLCRQYSLLPMKNLSTVSLTQVNSLSAVSVTPVNNLSAVKMKNKQKFYL
jgi:hypothetical protein